MDPVRPRLLYSKIWRESFGQLGFVYWEGACKDDRKCQKTNTDVPYLVIEDNEDPGALQEELHEEPHDHPLAPPRADEDL